MGLIPSPQLRYTIPCISFPSSSLEMSYSKLFDNLTFVIQDYKLNGNKTSSTMRAETKVRHEMEKLDDSNSIWNINVNEISLSTS